MTKKQQYHYFATSCLHWNTDEDLLKCLEKQKRKDQNKSSPYQATMCAVYKVPLPIDADYEIDNYAPVVEGVELVAKINY